MNRGEGALHLRASPPTTKEKPLISTPALVAPSAGAAFEARTVEHRDLRATTCSSTSCSPASATATSTRPARSGAARSSPWCPATRSPASSSAVGAGVTKYKVGDRVGVGCMVDSCGECEFCKDGDEQYCSRAPSDLQRQGLRRRADQGRLRPAGRRRRAIRRQHPGRLELDVAAPLLCAGITTYRRSSAERRTGQARRRHRPRRARPHGREARRGDGRRGQRAAAAPTPRRTTARPSARSTTTPPRTSRPSRACAGSFDLILDTVARTCRCRPTSACCARSASSRTSAPPGNYDFAAVRPRRRQPRRGRLDDRRHPRDRGDARLLRRARHRRRRSR